MPRRRDDDYDDEYDDRRDDGYDDRPARRRDDAYDDEYAPAGTPPPNYLVPAILVTLFCCLIGGIVAIVNASQVNTKWAEGDAAGAKRASDQAKLWCIVTAVVGVFTSAAVVALQIYLLQNAP